MSGMITSPYFLMLLGSVIGALSFNVVLSYTFNNHVSGFIYALVISLALVIISLIVSACVLRWQVFRSASTK